MTNLKNPGPSVFDGDTLMGVVENHQQRNNFHLI